MSKSSAMKMKRSPFAGNAKWFAGAGALVVVIAGLIVLARPEAQPARPATAEMAAPAAPGAQAAAPGQLSAMRLKYDFGPISMASGKVSYRYPVRNVGSMPVSVSKLYTSCMCTTAALVANGKATPAFGMPGHAPIPAIDVAIQPADQAYVEVVFDPAAHGPAGVGPIERVVTLENSSGRPLVLAFSALVTP